MTKEEYKELQDRMSRRLMKEKEYRNHSGKVLEGFELAVYAMKSVLYDYYVHQEGGKNDQTDIKNQ